MLIKNNLEVEDIRLGRIPFFDERNREFPIRSIVENKRLRSYTWQCNEWFNQGPIGACVGFSIAHELAARPVEQKGLNNKYIIEKIYWEAQKNDGYPGGSYPGASPKYEGTTVIAGVKEAKKLGFFESYRWAFSIDDLIAGLGFSGPSVLGINWYENMTKVAQNGFIEPTGRLQGGHAILARGVNLKNKYIILRNSWGKEWGKTGDCYISFDNMEKLLKENGEAVFFINLKIISI